MNIRFRFLSTLASLLAISFLVPAISFAAAPAPTCSLTVSGPYKDVVIPSTDSRFLVRVGDPIVFSWSSLNATSVIDPSGNVIPTSGTATITPQTTGNYNFSFKSGMHVSRCGLMLSVMTATIDSASLITPSKNPTISGTASITKTIRVDIATSTTATSTVFSSGVIPLSDGTWSAPVGANLPNGTYSVRVYGEYLPAPITTGTLIVGPVPLGSIYAASIPLLAGGTARLGTTVPISYLQVVNTGTTTVSITGFKVAEYGTTPASLITALSSVDGSGGSRATTTGIVNFTNGGVEVPSTATIAPNERKLFTIKATLGTDISTLGTQLKLNVIGIDGTIGSINTTFPIIGTTWTIGR